MFGLQILCAKKKMNKSWLGYKKEDDLGLGKVWDTIKGNLQTTVGVGMDGGNENRSPVEVFSLPLSSLSQTQYFYLLSVKYFSLCLQNCPHVQELISFNKNKFLKLKCCACQNWV